MHFWDLQKASWSRIVCNSNIFLKFSNILMTRFIDMMTIFLKLSDFCKNNQQHFWPYLWKWWTLNDAQYLISIALRIFVDANLYNFILWLRVLAEYCKISVFSFSKKNFYKIMNFWKKMIEHFWSHLWN